MPLSPSEVASLPGLVEAVLAIHRTLEPGRFLWYRGTPCQHFSLLPKLMRDGKPPEAVFERELRLLTRFRQRGMAYWPAGYPQNDWEHLFAMQHFGLPTRLLDWSENLFVATHFALGDPAHREAHEGQCRPTVWCIDPIAWNRSTSALADYGDAIHVLTTADDELEAYRPVTKHRRSRSPIAMYGAHNSARIVSQKGTFMVWGNEVVGLEGLASTQIASLWKIELTEERSELAKSLQQLGFDETMVFPELPSLAVELSRTEGWKA